MKKPARGAKEVFPGVFSRHAAAYRDRITSVVARREARGRERALELLGVRGGERVLDLGCGPGTLTFPLAAAAGGDGWVVGVDLAEGMLALARAEAPPNVVLARMDIERLALRDAVFDAAACGHALQFCPDLGQALSEARRALRDGGRFAASFPAGGCRRPIASLIDDVFARLLPAAPEIADQRRTTEVVRDPARARDAARAAGFRRVDVARVEELVTFSGPEELIERSMSWWDCAWRLESVPAEQRERLRAEALEALRAQVGDGPLELPGATHVLFAVR